MGLRSLGAGFVAALFLAAGCRERPEAESDLARAVREAHGLEAALHAEPRGYSSYEAVLAHYRQRFGEEIARRQAAYSWDSTSGGLRAGDVSMAPPDSLIVLATGADTAIVAYHTPAVLQELWGLKPYMVERLRLEGERWIVVESTPTETRPAGLSDRTT